MNKAIKKTLGMALLCLSVLTMGTGCAAQPLYQTGSYTIGAGEVECIFIDVADRKIELRESQDGQIHLSYAESEKEAYRILVEDKKLSMSSEYNKKWTDYFGGIAALEDRTIYLSIPSGEIQTLQLNSSNEDILVPALEISESLQIFINHGDILLEGVAVGGNIKVEAKNGNISGRVYGTYDDFSILSKAHKGESNLPSKKEGGRKALEAYTNNGNIDLRLEK